MSVSNINYQVRPTLEKVEPDFGSSFTLMQFEEESKGEGRSWHFHPELELVFLSEGKGKRHIGNHISYFKKGDLILMGPNLPHYGFRNRLTADQKEIVLQFREDFLGESFFKVEEMKAIGDLIDRSRSGISFHGDTKRIIGSRLKDLFYMNPFEKITSLLNILQILAGSEEFTILNAEGYTIVVENQDNNRIDIIYEYVRSNFMEKITLEEIASQVNMMVPSFCRFFKKLTNKTFIEFLNEFRVVHAVKLISEESLTITEICYECGFNNFSHFTKQFKKYTGKSPSQYRKSLVKHVK